MLRQFKAFGFELFFGIDGSENSTPDLFARLHFARDFVCPVMWYVAIWAGGANAGAVFVVHRFLQFRVNVVFHLVTTDAKGFGVGYFKGCVETAPENNTGKKAGDD